MANKVILIGAINEGKVPICGETMKNQLFIKRFKELFDEVITVDTLNWKQRPWVLLKLFFVLLFNRGAKVIISASGSATYLIKFLYYVPLKKNVYFWVVGGDIAKAISNGLYGIKTLKNLKYILVQGRSMVDDLAKFGITNVLHVPNSKPISYTPDITEKKDREKYRFVFLSRVHPDKGISEILDATALLNKKGLQDKFEVDFYGKIEPNYKEKFDEMLINHSNTHYQGFLNLTNNDGYKTLSSYDVMLFPTYWGGEGFPGIVIDANISGLPIIASDWNMNREVIKDGETGFIIPTHDSLALSKYMEKFILREIDLFKMRSTCIEHVKKFDSKNVISKELLTQIGLIK